MARPLKSAHSGTVPACSLAAARGEQRDTCLILMTTRPPSDLDPAIPPLPPLLQPSNFCVPGPGPLTAVHQSADVALSRQAM